MAGKKGSYGLSGMRHIADHGQCRLLGTEAPLTLRRRDDMIMISPQAYQDRILGWSEIPMNMGTRM
jgi:hypothetical protein